LIRIGAGKRHSCRSARCAPAWFPRPNLPPPGSLSNRRWSTAYPWGGVAARTPKPVWSKLAARTSYAVS